MNYHRLVQLAHLFIMFISLDARISRRHQKRSADGSCASNANQQMHETFSRLINRKDEDMFSFFQPDTQVLLEYQPHHRHILSPVSRECTVSPEKSAEILPDQPLAERSICPYHHILNYDEKRIPAAISEVECSCQHVKVNGGIIHCEPMMYNMRVMIFDEMCEKYVERVQKIALACVPVFSNHISSGTYSIMKPTMPSTPL